MPEPEKPPQSLDEALLMLQADLPTLVKDRRGQAGNQPTKYADLVQVNQVVLSKLNALGVIYKAKPTVRESEPRFVLHYTLRHVASDTSDEGDYPLQLSDNPQRMGSAISYARRYVLLALTGVAAEDEDDDGDAATGRRTAQRANARSRAAAPPADEERPTAQRAQRRTERPPLPGEPRPRSDQQLRKIMAQFGELGISDRASRLATTSTLAGRDLKSANDLTMAEAKKVIDAIEKALATDAPLAALETAMSLPPGGLAASVDDDQPPY